MEPTNRINCTIYSNLFYFSSDYYLHGHNACSYCSKQFTLIRWYCELSSLLQRGNNSYNQSPVLRCARTIFFPRVILLCLYREPKPKKPRRPHTTGPKPHQLKAPTPKTQNKTPTPKPQTPNHHK